MARVVRRRRRRGQLRQRRRLARRARASPTPRRRSPTGWWRRTSARRPSTTSCATGCSAASATGASRSRSSTTTSTCRSRCPSRCCRWSCPRSSTSSPRSWPTTPRACPAPPLSRAEAWVTVELDLGDGPKAYRRELNTMPQWAGSCWYYLRYLDPTNEDAFVSVEAERYWMQPGPGGVDLYVGGVEHAVLHLLYARFWHKVLFDLGPRLHAGAVPAAVQPGLHPGARVHRRARPLRRGERGRRAGRHVHLRGRGGLPRVREDRQEPEEHGHARRHLPRLRRRHAPPLRDGDGSAGRVAARGARATSSACTASSSGCGGT